MEEHQRNAVAVGRFLEHHPAVVSVRWASLAGKVKNKTMIPYYPNKQIKIIHVEVPESSQSPATRAGEKAAVWPLWDALILHERGLGTQQDLPLLSPGEPHFKHRRFAFASCKCVYVFGGF